MKELLKRFAFRHTRFGAPAYPYNLDPVQLAEFVLGIDRVLDGVEHGTIVEVGVARGLTTRFVAEHIERQQLSCDYVCIDTFSSFVGRDVDHEVRHRGKRRDDLSGFAYNDLDAWKRNFADRPFVTAIQADVSDFDFSAIGPVHACLLDVDLYLPTKAALERLLPHLAPGGFVMVDDVRPDDRWDGAHQAFHEVVDELGLDHRLVGTKGGVIDVA